MTPARIATVAGLGVSVAVAMMVATAGARGPLPHVPGKPTGGIASAAPVQSAADAGAPQPALVPAEIMVLHATNADAGIDPGISSLPQLRKPPFSAYNTYRLIARQSITLSPTKPDTTKLPNGRVLRTMLVAVLPNDRYRISASISQPQPDAGEHSFLPLLEVTAKSGETFFVAGQSYPGGVLVVGIKVGR